VDYPLNPPFAKKSGLVYVIPDMMFYK
jgi:hypothetical protein